MTFHGNRRMATPKPDNTVGLGDDDNQDSYEADGFRTCELANDGDIDTEDPFNDVFGRGSIDNNFNNNFNAKDSKAKRSEVLEKQRAASNELYKKFKCKIHHGRCCSKSRTTGRCVFTWNVTELAEWADAIVRQLNLRCMLFKLPSRRHMKRL
jgi:hypothetical protein